MVVAIFGLIPLLRLGMNVTFQRIGEERLGVRIYSVYVITIGFDYVCFFSKYYVTEA